jgi:hypothetical protein
MVCNITSCCENTVKEVRGYYRLHDGKREYFDKKPVSGSYVEYYFSIRPQLFFLPETWKRYDLTLDDLKLLYKKYDPEYMFQATLIYLHNVRGIAPAFMQTTPQSPFRFIFSARMPIFKQYYSHQNVYDIPSGGSTLFQIKGVRPSLLRKNYTPVKHVDRKQWELLKRSVPFKHPSFHTRVNYSFLLSFKDILMVPTDHFEEINAVCMTRVIKKKSYMGLPFKLKKCILNMPIIVTYCDEEYVLTEESCMFFPKSNKRKDHPESKASKKKRILQVEDI